MAAFLLVGLMCACGVSAPPHGNEKNPIVPYDPTSPTVDAASPMVADAASDAFTEASGGDASTDPEAAPPPAPITTVFVILMSYQAWSAVAGSMSAPYINGLLPTAAYSSAYYAAPVQIQLSEPNTLWLEAGQDEGFENDDPPTMNHSASTTHLVDQLEAAGISWKAYVDGIPAGACPIADNSPFRTYNVPFLFFDDVVGNPPSTTAKRCIDHVVPFSQLADDLAAKAAPRYAFIVPDDCDNMHDDCNTGDPVRQGDDWLSKAVPAVVASSAYADGGALFIAWDFSDTGYVPIGLIALSAKARPGFAGVTTLTTSSTLRSLQEIFGVTPLLGDAAKATDLAELFTSFP